MHITKKKRDKNVNLHYKIRHFFPMIHLVLDILLVFCDVCSKDYFTSFSRFTLKSNSLVCLFNYMSSFIHNW